MAAKSTCIVPLIAFLACAAASSAHAACGDRPGTPNNLSAEVTSATSIRFKFRITTRDNEVNRYYDAYIYEEVPPPATNKVPKHVTVKSYTGARAHGPYFLGFGGIDHFNFNDLKPGGKYCFRIRARTEAGTKGCVSAIWAGPLCTTIPGGPSERPASTASGPFGALAADSKGHWGYAVAQATEAQARDAALKGCGNAACKIAISGQRRCIAYYDSRRGTDYWYGLALGGTEAQVRTVAQGGCAKGAPAGTCKLVKAHCAR